MQSPDECLLTKPLVVPMELQDLGCSIIVLYNTLGYASSMNVVSRVGCVCMSRALEDNNHGSLREPSGHSTCIKRGTRGAARL